MSLQVANFPRFECAFTCPVMSTGSGTWCTLLCACILYKWLCLWVPSYSISISSLGCPEASVKAAVMELVLLEPAALLLLLFSRSVVSASLRPRGLQHVRPPYPSPSPRACSSSYPLCLMPPNHLILCHPLLFLPSIFPSIRVFSRESALRIRWPQYWGFSFSISLSNEHSTLLPFRMDWLDLLAVQGILKSLLQHHSSKASILWPSSFFIVQLSLPYMTTGKTIALTRWTFVGKVMPLLFNALSRFGIAFLPRSKHLLVSLLQSLLHFSRYCTAGLKVFSLLFVFISV